MLPQLTAIPLFVVHFIFVIRQSVAINLPDRSKKCVSVCVCGAVATRYGNAHSQLRRLIGINFGLGHV